MKKLLISILFLLLFANPIISFAEEIIPSNNGELITNEEIVLDGNLTSVTGSAIYNQDFTAEEKAIVIDSIQTIRAIMVFIVFVLVFCGIIIFLNWFF